MFELKMTLEFNVKTKNNTFILLNRVNKTNK